jgi:uncharacterized protein
MYLNQLEHNSVSFQGVSTYILKVASRCNLNCSYCYMYNMGDDTYLKQPKFITMDIVEKFADKLNLHAQNYSLERVLLAFHGGEPLLWGVDRIVQAKNLIRRKIDAEIDIEFTVQTNGVLLDESIISELAINDIYIGISLDGLKETHDKYRIDFKGKGSFDNIINKFDFIKTHQKYLSILTVINLDINPRDYFHFLLENDVNNINVILLEANYDKLPNGYNTIEDRSKVLYGKWLAELFDIWVSHLDQKRIDINIFDVILGLLTGRNVGDQIFGKGLNDVMTIESNGSIEAVDMLRITESGFTRNEINVFDNQLDEILQEESFRGYYFGHHDLCDTCEKCDFKSICGGGLNIHRYNKENGFDNPSVYCHDLQYIISHINDYLISLTEVE